MIILSPFQQGAFSRRLPEKDIERIPCPPPAARGLRRRREQGISHYVKILCPESLRDQRVLMDGSGYSCWLLGGFGANSGASGTQRFTNATFRKWVEHDMQGS